MGTGESFMIEGFEIMLMIMLLVLVIFIEVIEWHVEASNDIERLKELKKWKAKHEVENDCTRNLLAQLSLENGEEASQETGKKLLPY